MDIANLIVAIIAMIAACVAAYFAFKGPSRQDLELVEKNTAATAEQITAVRGHIAKVEDHLGIQNSRAELIAAGKKVSITVAGESWFQQQEPILLTLADPEISLMSLDLINDSEMFSGNVDCARASETTFTAVIPGSLFVAWYNNGTSVDMITTNHRVFMRVNLTIGGLNMTRKVPVMANLQMRANSPQGGMSYLQCDLWCLLISCRTGGPDLNAIYTTGCPIFAASFAAKVGIRATREPWLLQVN
jgi:hypothetical protein